MGSPTQFYPVNERPYTHKPHTPRTANTEAKRQPRAKRRARSLRALRTLKIVSRWSPEVLGLPVVYNPPQPRWNY